MLEDQAQSLITNRSGWSGIAGVVGDKLIQLHVLWIYFRFFLTQCYNKGFRFSTIAGFRSAISANHDSIGRVSIGSNVRISDLLSGIFNIRLLQTLIYFYLECKEDN